MTANETRAGGGVAPGIREARRPRRRSSVRAVPPEARMRAVIGVIARHVAEHGYAPSMQEIVEETGFSSTSVVMYWLGRCEEAGLIVRGRRMARAIALTEAGRALAEAPPETGGLPLRRGDPAPAAGLTAPPAGVVMDVHGRERARRGDRTR